MTEDQIVDAIAAIEAWMAAQKAGEGAKVIEGEAEVVPSLPAPGTPTTGNERSACSQTAATYRKRQE